MKEYLIATLGYYIQNGNPEWVRIDCRKTVVEGVDVYKPIKVPAGIEQQCLTFPNSNYSLSYIKRLTAFTPLSKLEHTSRVSYMLNVYNKNGFHLKSHDIRPNEEREGADRIVEFDAYSICTKGKTTTYVVSICVDGVLCDCIIIATDNIYANKLRDWYDILDSGVRAVITNSGTVIVGIHDTKVVTAGDGVNRDVDIPLFTSNIAKYISTPQFGDLQDDINTISGTVVSTVLSIFNTPNINDSKLVFNMGGVNEDKFLYGIKTIVDNVTLMGTPDHIERCELVGDTISMVEYDRYFPKSNPKKTIGYRGGIGGTCELSIKDSSYRCAPLCDDTSKYRKLPFLIKGMADTAPLHIPGLYIYYSYDISGCIQDMYIKKNGNDDILRCIPYLKNKVVQSHILGDVLLQGADFQTFIKMVVLAVDSLYDIMLYRYMTLDEIMNLFIMIMGNVTTDALTLHLMHDVNAILDNPYIGSGKDVTICSIGRCKLNYEKYNIEESHDTGRFLQTYVTSPLIHANDRSPFTVRLQYITNSSGQYISKVLILTASNKEILVRFSYHGSIIHINNSIIIDRDDYETFMYAISTVYKIGIQTCKDLFGRLNLLYYTAMKDLNVDDTIKLSDDILNDKIEESVEMEDIKETKIENAVEVRELFKHNFIKEVCYLIDNDKPVPPKMFTKFVDTLKLARELDKQNKTLMGIMTDAINKGSSEDGDDK